MLTSVEQYNAAIDAAHVAHDAAIDVRDLAIMTARAAMDAAEAAADAAYDDAYDTLIAALFAANAAHGIVEED